MKNIRHGKEKNFHGKIVYELDDGKSYEVFRDFNKKNPKIYNEKAEDISKQFNIDKTKGNQFFVEQTQIDESVFSSTTLVAQQQIVLDEQDKTTLTQKIANILTTGEENISYNKSINKLNKKIIDEIGSDRTVGKPKNVLNQKLQQLINEKKELNYLEQEKNEIEERKNNLEKNIIEINIEKDVIKEIKDYKEELEQLNQKIEIKSEYLDEEKKNLHSLIENEPTKNSKNNNLILKNIILVILIIFNILDFSLIKSFYLSIAFLILTIIYLFYYFISNIKFKKINNENKNVKIKLNNEREILQKNIKEKEQEIDKLKNEFNSLISNNSKKIEKKYSGKIQQYILNDLLNLSLKNINNKNEENENELTRIKLELNTLNIQEKNNIQKIERKVEIEESLKNTEEKLMELESLERVMCLTKNSLEKAYEKIKENITPKFTKNLEKIAQNIIGEKYKKIKFNNDNELIVETANGDYINANRLSIGTIDELYLSLRLSAMSEISKENMPIILDETFAYFDDERLTNILKYLEKNYRNNQIIIFTCSNREKNIMDNLNIHYKMIEI